MKTAIKKNAFTALFVGLALCLALAVSYVGSVPMRAHADDKTLDHVEYAAHQIISYGKLVADELDDNATLVYTDGSTQDVKIEFGDVTAHTGVNVNYTTITVAGVIKETGATVKVDVTTMPDDLVYFINCGSYDVDGKYDNTADKYYSYNQTIYDYYGDALINKGKADQKATKGGNDWGYYTKATYTAPGDATFPYNTLIWTDEEYNMGYMLTDLAPNEKYRITIGTLSAWHPRTVDITFNGAVVGSKDLRINASKGYTTYEDVPADGNGKIDLYMKGESTDEPCINFIAVQPMSVQVEAIPSNLVTEPTLGMDAHTITFTSGAQSDAKLQLYNANKPNQIIYEEKVDGTKITADGAYTVDFGTPVEDISQINCVQVTSGGVSAVPALVTITDIKDFAYTLSTGDAYTAGAVTVTITANSESGIVGWSYRKGEYGVAQDFEIEKVFKMQESFTVTENDDYYVVITSGSGVTYSDVVTVSTIDTERPVLTILPAASGWKAGAYNVTLRVEGIAPVAKYVLYKDGVQVASENKLPSTVTFTSEGDYTVSVTNAAGLSAVKSVSVKNKPTTTVVTKSFVSRTLKYTFGDSDAYKVASVSAYQVGNGSADRVTIASGNVMDVYSAGTYVVTVTTESGEVEMFSLTATAAEVRGRKTNTSGLDAATALGVGLGVGLGGVVLAAVAIVLVLVLTKGKKAQTASKNGTQEEKKEEGDETQESDVAKQ